MICKCCGKPEPAHKANKTGYCDFCDKNTQFYMPNLKCHNPKSIEKGECYHEKGFYKGHCYNCGAIEQVVNFWKEKGKLYLGNGILK